MLRFVVRDTYGICSRLHPVYLVNRQHSVLADQGFDDGCSEPDGDQGVVHDAMFTIPF